jgi:hypothetical protein
MPFILLRNRHTPAHETPPYLLDTTGTLHSIDSVPGESNDLYVHLWTNFSTGRVESRVIDSYDFDEPILPFFPNLESGGVDFVYWRRNSSLNVREFLQYSVDSMGNSRTMVIARVGAELFDYSTGWWRTRVAWNGTHPFIVRYAGVNRVTTDSPLANLSVLWPGENDFQFSGMIEQGNALMDVDIGETGNIILWVRHELDASTQRIIGWSISRAHVALMANFTISDAYDVYISRDQEGNYWLLAYFLASGATLYLLAFYKSTGEYDLVQKNQQSLVAANRNIKLGVYGTTPFITYLSISPELESPSPVPFLGYWISSGKFVSLALDTKHQNSESMKLYTPIGGNTGLIVPYFIEGVAYKPDFEEHSIDPSQEMDGVYIATNYSEMESLRPAIFNLREERSYLLPLFWPIIVAVITLGGVGGSVGYWYIKRRRKDVRLINTLGVE